jgi:2,5-dihydroxypyridine 5,6-dioxygenase
MLTERIEGKWINCFMRVFELCNLKPGDTAAILSETLSRQINVQLSELALQRLGVRAFHVVVPTPPQEVPVTIRSTGASNAIQQIKPVVVALTESTAVIDVTVEGILHSVERQDILSNGSRIMMISNEHPDVLERLMPNPAWRPKIEAGAVMMRSAKTMRITSSAGTDLIVDLTDALCNGSLGYTDQPGGFGLWPSGMCVANPIGGAVNGTVVMAPGDANLTFKRLIERPITMRIEKDFITSIEGEGLDADLMRSYFAAWGDKNAYATSHLGWGMNPRARWDALTMYDRGDVNGTELRVFAGNFLFSTGASRRANRYTLGHFDLPMRNCTVSLDNNVVVKEGRVVDELALTA